MDTIVPPRTGPRTAQDDWAVRSGRFPPHSYGEYTQAWYDGINGVPFAAGPVVYVQGYRDGAAERKARGIPDD